MKTDATKANDAWNKETAARLELKNASGTRMKDYELAWLELHRAGPKTTADTSLFNLITRFFKAQQVVAAKNVDLEARATSMNASMTPYVKKRSAASGRLALEFNLARMSVDDEAEVRALLLEQRARKASSASAPQSQSSDEKPVRLDSEPVAVSL